MSLGPEQVEEEAAAEDGGYGDADEDVEGECADDVVIVDVCAVVAAALDAGLLVHVICERGLLACVWLRS